jgi:ubiquinone/menaquinone biosynthesis C-methylase UbiE
VEKELGAEVAVILRTSREYASEKDAPPCPSVKVGDAFVVRRGLMTYDQLKSAVMRADTDRSGENAMHELNALNRQRYAVTAWFYDILDYPWELQYRKWRPELLRDVTGEVLEAGVGTGRNLKHYQASVNLTAVDFSPAMLRRASKRSSEASCVVRFVHEDVCRMESVPSGSYDWVVAFFLCCVLPNELQERAIAEFARVLKPGGRFRLLEMQYSKQPHLRKRQDRFASFVENVYGARFDRETTMHVLNNPDLEVTGTRYIKHDTYLLIDGIRRSMCP